MSEAREAYRAVIADLERQVAEAEAARERAAAALAALRLIGGGGEEGRPAEVLALEAPRPVARMQQAAAAEVVAERRVDGRTVSKLPPVDEGRFREMYEGGARARDIRVAFGRSAGSKQFVPEMARRFGLAVRPTGWKPPGWSNGRGHGPRGRGPRAAEAPMQRPAERAPASAAAPAARAPGEADEIARFIREKGVTQCPPAVVAPSAHLEFRPTAELRAHEAAMVAKAAAAAGPRGQRDASARAAGLVVKPTGRGAALARGGGR